MKPADSWSTGLARRMVLAVALSALAAGAAPLGPIGGQATYHLATATPLRATTVSNLVLTFGPETRGPLPAQWLRLEAFKANGESFRVWLLADAYPARPLREAETSVARYLVQEGEAEPKEFVHRFTGEPVLPTTGAWEFLWPRPESGSFAAEAFPKRVTWLGHNYALHSATQTGNELVLPQARRLELLPDVLVGVPSNTRTKDDTRRWDGSEYEMVRLTRENYAEMIRAGLNCFRVDAEQADWIKDEPVFYWGVGGKDVPYPECLFRSTYLGPTLFFDEPAVHTRDYVVRPRLAKEPALRSAITPEFMFREFTNLFHETVAGAPWGLLKGLGSRPDVDLGSLRFPQRNLYTWETMIASAAWQLTAEPEGGPGAIVFEPPGRLGTRRTLPEMNMAYGCEIPADNPANFAGIVMGFLRGAARAADKDWGVSIYGAVEQADAPWLLTHAYDLGATRFFFWDNYQLACVPYGEYLALARHLQAHVRSRPHRDLERLKHVAETLILLPPGYDLGHTHMGRGNLWGLGELNLERTNRHGIKYRQVMGNFFTEIERCLRLGIAFDLRWDLPGLSVDDYREVVRVRDDGRVEITTAGRRTLRRNARVPTRSLSAAPRLKVTVQPPSSASGNYFIATAEVIEGHSPVYYTTGTDRNGIYQNVMVLWELFGPQPEDYRQWNGRVPEPGNAGPGAVLVESRYPIERPGTYRLRVATTDLRGRSAVVWEEFRVGQ